MTAVISCRGIRKSYGEGENRLDALRGVNLDIEKGKLTLIVGPSGSGKSTLLSIITTLLQPDEGELYLLGEEIHEMTEAEKTVFCRNNVGIVFQSLFLIPTLTVLENVMLPLIIAGVSEKEAEAKGMQVLTWVKMAHRCESSPAMLSKGQQQRIAIARALVNDSELIVCDEPTSALDHVSGGEVMALLHKLVLEAGKTVIVVTHDNRTFSYADRIVRMEDGMIEKDEQR